LGRLIGLDFPDKSNCLKAQNGTTLPLRMLMAYIFICSNVIPQRVINYQMFDTFYYALGE
jgi:hypothetical protein